MRKSDLFYCYSINLLRYLRKSGHNHIEKGTHHTTGNDYWVFVRTPSFLQTLTNFTMTKNEQK